MTVTVSARLPIEHALALEERGRRMGLTNGKGEVNVSETIRVLLVDAMEEGRSNGREEEDDAT